MSNAVGNRGSVVQESPIAKSGHNSLQTGTNLTSVLASMWWWYSLLEFFAFSSSSNELKVGIWNTDDYTQPLKTETCPGGSDKRIQV